jgi:hypothetical protein
VTKNLHLAFIATSLAAVFCETAAAQSTQLGTPSGYVSMSAGPSRANVDCTDTTQCDRSSTAAKILVGYRFIPNLAVEASYSYLGKATASASADGDTASASIKGQSLGLGIAGLLPFGANNDWTGIARVGIASNRTHVDASLNGISGSDSETHAEPYFGLGLDYAFTPSFAAGVAWDTTKIRYSDVSARVNVFSVVGTFRF